MKELVAVSIGADKCQETLRQALALGADRAIHLKTKIRTDQELQPLAVSKILQKVVEKENADLVICGKQSIDSDSNQVFVRNTKSVIFSIISVSTASFTKLCICS